MHYLTRQHLHLSRFHPLMKLLLTLYILSVAGGLWVASLKYTDRAEWSADGAARYVRGEANPAVGAAQDQALFGDPLGGTEEGLMLHEPLSRRQLVDIVHPHLFTVPLVIFLLGHLLHLTRLPDVLKGALNVAAFAAFCGTFLAPFALSDAATLGHVIHLSGTLLLVSFALLCAIPLWELWLGRPGAGFDAIPRRVVSGPRSPQP